MHGELAMVLPAEINCGLHQMVAAYGDTVFIRRTVVRSVHPGSPAGDAAVPDQFQAGRKDLTVPVHPF